MQVHGQHLTTSAESWGEPYGRGLGEQGPRLQAGRWVGQWGTKSDLCFHCREDRGGLWGQGMHHGGGAWAMGQDLHPAQWTQWVWSGLDDRDHWDEVTGFM